MNDSVPIVRTAQDLHRQIGRWRAKGQRCALVPTMGALHEGHLSLVDIGRSRADRVIATIFVNPTQFAPSEDLDAYPRDPAGDLALLAARSTDLVYMPSVQEMYPAGFATQVTVSGLTDCLCGLSRPRFFAGVATVVAKLLNQAGADFAVFGEKDYQQLLVVRRMVRDLDIPTEILAGPIIREPDGLAMSSRNAYLSAEQRRIAGAFNSTLARAAAAVGGGGNAAEAMLQARAALEAAGVDRIDYLEIRQAETLAPDAGAGPRRIFGAIFIGTTRLIDNVPLP